MSPPTSLRLKRPSLPRNGQGDSSNHERTRGRLRPTVPITLGCWRPPLRMMTARPRVNPRQAPLAFEGGCLLPPAADDGAPAREPQKAPPASNASVPACSPRQVLEHRWQKSSLQPCQPSKPTARACAGETAYLATGRSRCRCSLPAVRSPRAWPGAVSSSAACPQPCPAGRRFVSDSGHGGSVGVCVDGRLCCSQPGEDSNASGTPVNETGHDARNTQDRGHAES